MKVFTEAVRLQDGQPENLRYHQKRVDKTLRDFCLPSLSLDVIRYNIPQTARKGVFKCRLLYGEKTESLEFLPYRPAKRLSVAVVNDDYIEYSYKYRDRNALNALVQASGCDDVIIVKNGLVTDASYANLVFVSEEGCFTPSTPLLAGTRRQQLLDDGIIYEREIKRENIKDYSWMKFINAMMDLKAAPAFPVSRLNCR